MTKWLILSSLMVVCLGAHIPTQSPKIIGGEPIDIREVPYEVVVEVYGMLNCGGSIVADNVILTAGHCLEFPIENMTVRAGTSLYNVGGSKHQVVDSKRHPKYSEDHLFDYDVGLLFIDPPVVLDETRQIIKISDRKPVQGENIISSGWGVTSENGSPSEQLLFVELPVIDWGICKDMYHVVETSFVLAITPRMFCDGTPGHDHCQGDSGSPIARDGEQVGVVSWALGCAREQYPGVNANLADSEIRQWLRETAGV